MRAAKAVVAALLATLLAPAVASAGGWATVGLSSLPDGTAAGKPWVVDLTVLQHGRTPLAGVEPAVILRGPQGGQRFAARPTDRPGVYRARVVFPARGTYRYTVDDGFSRTHALGSVRIGAPAGAAAAPQDGGVPWATLALAALAAVGAGLAARATARRRTLARA